MLHRMRHLHLVLDKTFLLMHNTSMEQDKRTYQVFVEYDGCLNELPRCEGTHKQCLDFMRGRSAPKHCEWALVDKKAGRCVSYVL